MCLPPPPIGYVAHLRFPSGGQTLIGSRAQRRVLDMWAYLGVFGLVQWATLVGLLLAAGLVSWCVFSFGKKGALSSLEMILLRVVQLGSHDRGDTQMMSANIQTV